MTGGGTPRDFPTFHFFLFHLLQEDIQAPLNRQILKSSETVMYTVDLLNNLVATFLGPVDGSELTVRVPS